MAVFAFVVFQIDCLAQRFHYGYDQPSVPLIQAVVLHHPFTAGLQLGPSCANSSPRECPPGRLSLTDFVNFTVAAPMAIGGEILNARYRLRGTSCG
jgi:hypothetical protein